MNKLNRVTFSKILFPACLFLLSIYLLGFIVNWDIITFPVKTKYFKTIQPAEIKNTNLNIFCVSGTVKNTYYDYNKQKIIILEELPDFKLYTNNFDNIEQDMKYLFTIEKLKHKHNPLYFIICVDKKILFPVFFLNYFFLFIALLILSISLMLFRLRFLKPVFSPENELKIYKDLLEKYLTEEEFFNKVNNSKIFISPKFSNTIQALNTILNLEKDENKKLKIKKFINKCISKK